MNAGTAKTLALLALVGALAGCSDAPSAPDDPTEMSDAEQTTPPPEPLAPGEWSVQPPEWEIGDWWTWRIESGGHDLEVTTGVAAVDGDTALVGLVLDADATIAPWFHTPPIGVVDLTNLEYEAHDLPMRFLRFPIVGSDAWEGEIEGDAITLSANVSETTDRILIQGHYESGRLAVALEYGVVEETIDRLALHYGSTEPWAIATLIGFGQDLDAPLWVPSLDDVYVGSVWREAPTDTHPFEVAGDVTHLLLGCDVGGAAGTGTATLIGPDGATTSCPRDTRTVGTSATTDVFAVPATPGQWVLDLKSVGDAFVTVEMAAMTLVEA